MTNDPAKAKEEILNPNKLKIPVPKNKKLIIIPAQTKVDVEGLILKPSFFILMIIGMLPIISMTEKRITVTDIAAV